MTDILRADGRTELVGLAKDQIRAAFEAAGLEAKPAKLRAKQVWHWIYHRGIGDFAAMSDIAKAQRLWLADLGTERHCACIRGGDQDGPRSLPTADLRLARRLCRFGSSSTR